MTIEKVRNILEQLRSENVKPTFRIILERLGGGSYATLTKLKKEFPEVFVDMQTNKARQQNSGLEQRVFELELENMRLKCESERHDLELIIDELQRDKVQIEQRERDALRRNQELESELSECATKG